MDIKPQLGPLKAFNTIGWKERQYLLNSLKRPLSGYLGGIHTGGYWVERLSDEWKSTFKCNHAIPCNSATSGLLAACIAVGIGPGDLVYAPVYTMSATAACAKVLEADVQLIDIESNRYGIDPELITPFRRPKAIIVTNLFGHPAYLKEIRAFCDRFNIIMIEDNAQSAFAVCSGKYTGTIGHIGVFSLNVHKHMQTGEGGVVVTQYDSMAMNIRDAINHGELRQGGTGKPGLNLRMTEPIAAMACAQLARGPEIIRQRRELAHEIDSMVRDIPFIRAPLEAIGCTHVYYIWAAKVSPSKRGALSLQLNWHGVPVRPGYSPLLSDIFEPNRNDPGKWPMARAMEDRELMTLELCAYEFSNRQRKTMREIFKIVSERVDQIRGDDDDHN